MRKIMVGLLIFFGFWLQTRAQQAPVRNAVAAAPDSLGQDSLPTDSSRFKVPLVSRALLGVKEKKKDSALPVKKLVHIRDSVVVVTRVVDSPVRRRAAAVALVVRDSVKSRLLPPENNAPPKIGWLLAMGLLLLFAGAVGWWGYKLGLSKTVAANAAPAIVPPAVESEKAAVASDQEVIISGKAGFVCEMMMTAGPRKKFMNEENADKDLGEDVCGCVIWGDKAGLWVLDGTSDQYCLRHPVTGKEYFSSRLLAQGIGDRLREAFTGQSGNGYALDLMMAEAIEGVRMEWVRGFRELPPEEQELLKENINHKNCPECASTLLSAVLSLDGGLSVYRSGDSKLLLFRRPEKEAAAGLIPLATSFTTKNPDSNDRIFFRMIIDKSGQLDILCNKPGYEVSRQEKINTVIAFSDGIGPVTEESLKKEYGEDPMVVRRRIVTDSQGTADDKSICFIRIKENS